MCSIPGCEKPVFGRGWCGAHYAKWRKYGNPTVVRQKQLHGLTITERFERFVEKSDGCWIWTGYKDPNGYGRLPVNGRSMLAHRISWQLHLGDMGKMYVCHKCDTPACVNPAHLFLGTQTDNLLDMWEKGRARPMPSHGEKHGRAKLNDEKVRAIRASSESTKSLARRFVVSETVIHDVRVFKTWRHIT